MNALTLDDLLPLEEFAARRRDFLTAHGRYLDRYRRVRVARLGEPARVEQELLLFNRLLPGRDRLAASLLLAIEDEAKVMEELAPWRELRGDDLTLHLGSLAYSANLFTARPEDRCIGTAHWVQFVLDNTGREQLADLGQPAFVAVACGTYRHDSAALSEEMRQSLLDDLALSDRDAPAA
jgi:hypothetical protein